MQIALRDETKLKVRGSVSLEKLMRSRTLILRKTKASLIFPSKYGQYLWRKNTVCSYNFKKKKKGGFIQSSLQDITERTTYIYLIKLEFIFLSKKCCSH